MHLRNYVGIESMGDFDDEVMAGGRPEGKKKNA